MNVFDKKKLEEQVVVIKYCNWRGEVELRRILPGYLSYGSTEKHREPQWLLFAYCKERRDVRMFAMKDVLEWHNTGDIDGLTSGSDVVEQEPSAEVDQGEVHPEG